MIRVLMNFLMMVRKMIIMIMNMTTSQELFENEFFQLFVVIAK